MAAPWWDLAKKPVKQHAQFQFQIINSRWAPAHSYTKDVKDQELPLVVGASGLI